MKKSQLKKIIREEVRRLDEIKGAFTDDQKELVKNMIYMLDGESIKTSDLKNYDLKYIKDMLKNHKNKISSSLHSTVDDIITTIEDIEKSKRLKDISGKGIAIVDQKKIKQDNSGPWATTGSSINRFTIKTKKSESELEDWLEKSLAKSSYMVSRKIKKIKSSKPNEFLVDIETTIWYN